eukprot:COSAG01_NODE_1735_length_9365_cov_3.816318_2_plen_152_part_00
MLKNDAERGHGALEFDAKIPKGKCRRAHLRLTRGHAHFKMNEWSKALMDFEAVMKFGDVEGFGKYKHPNLLRRVRMCKRRCNSPVTPPRDPVVELDFSSGEESQPEDPFGDCALSVEQLLKEFKEEDRIRAEGCQNRNSVELASSSVDKSV